VLLVVHSITGVGNDVKYAVSGGCGRYLVCCGQHLFNTGGYGGKVDESGRMWARLGEIGKLLVRRSEGWRGCGRGIV